MAELKTCHVCGEDVPPAREGWCNSCGFLYHLNQRADDEASECGQVSISAELAALEFVCNVCLPGPSDGLDEVLDLAEAAATACVEPAWLAAEAGAGRIKHRKTAGGTLLFHRNHLPTRGVTPK